MASLSAAIFSQFVKANALCSIRIIFTSPAAFQAWSVRFRFIRSGSSRPNEKKLAGKLTRVSHQFLSRRFCLHSPVVILKRQLNLIFALRVGWFCALRCARVIREECSFVGNTESLDSRYYPRCFRKHLVRVCAFALHEKKICYNNWRLL